MVAAGNPLKLRTLSDLARTGVRFINRSLGTGTRLLLDHWLLEAQLPTQAIQGYQQEESSHAAVAAQIASGQADVGLGIASAAHAQKLGFVPLTQENYWLVCLKSALDSPPIAQLREALQSSAWQDKINLLAGYTASPDCGRIQSLKLRLPWWN